MLIVDGNNLVYRNYHKLKTLDNGGVYGTLKSITFLLDSLKEFRVVVVWDGPKNPRRLAIHPNYKGHRSVKRDPIDHAEMIRQAALCRDLIKLLGVPQVKLGEADDTIYQITQQWKLERGEYYTIASGDKDFLQLVDESTRVFIHHKDALVTLRNFEEVAGVPADLFLPFLILMGDRSDDIPGLPGVGEKRAEDIVRQYGTIHELLKSEGKYGELARANREVLRKGRSLIDLSRISEDRPLTPEIVKPDFDQFFTTAKSMSMDSILTYRKHWEELFFINYGSWKLMGF